jgi:hypothetical protein
MDYIRWLHQDEFLHNHGRFPSTVFRNLGGSLSLVDSECVAANGISICDHARKYYRDTNTVGEPPIFWRFDGEILPNPRCVEEQPTKSGDKCHRNIYGITDKVLQKLFKWSDQSRTKLRELSEFTICAESGARPLTLDDLTPKQLTSANSLTTPG